jgi:hypothetical protein
MTRLISLRFFGAFVLFCQDVSVAVSAGAGKSADMVVVCSKPANDYQRTKLLDGSFQHETYSFGEGGYFAGPLHDDGIDNLKFIDVARMLAKPLATQGYVPESDPNKANLLLMVYWGVTGSPPPGDGTPALKALRQAEAAFADSIERHSLDRDDYEDRVVAALVMVTTEGDAANVGFLGTGPTSEFSGAGIVGPGSEDWSTLGARQHDVITKAEDRHYFVVMMAYDFHQMWKEQRHRLLWATSFSIQQRGHNFATDLPKIAEFAAPFFGQENRGILRKGIPQGLVILGPVRTLGEAGARKTPPPGP